LAYPGLPFVDTVQVARQKWSVYPTKLPDVCRHLKLELNHHEAGSDAEACARIVIAAEVDRG
jgi:DNA polymerase-3 subunit epsilon